MGILQQIIERRLYRPKNMSIIHGYQSRTIRREKFGAETGDISVDIVLTSDPLPVLEDLAALGILLASLGVGAQRSPGTRVPERHIERRGRRSRTRCRPCNMRENDDHKQVT